MNIGCVVSGDVVLECSHLKDDLVGEVLIFRVTFNTGFIRSNSLKFNREEIDLRWDSDGKIVPMDFKLEVKKFIQKAPSIFGFYCCIGELD